MLHKIEFFGGPKDGEVWYKAHPPSTDFLEDFNSVLYHYQIRTLEAKSHVYLFQGEAEVDG